LISYREGDKNEKSYLKTTTSFWGSDYFYSSIHERQCATMDELAARGEIVATGDPLGPAQ
jgi:hypothetical protein